jgi:3,4-dihydroxy 2-butanone 4-phosphate synthase/GTP cyclohydrolase II
MSFASIPEILEELKAGNMVVIVDDENRENEGDLVMAAERITPEAINFMATHGRGLICLALTEDKADSLDLPLMEQKNTEQFSTAFTVSIDGIDGVTTGISAFDRAKTIQTAIKDDCQPDELARPGHIFPLRAQEGGVLVRTGHTEASVDLARMAGLRPSGVICEIMAENGTMLRGDALRAFCVDHFLKMCSIEQLVEYRRKHEQTVERHVTVDLPTDYGEFKIHLYNSETDPQKHLALTFGDVGEMVAGETRVQEEPVLVRVHSECLTGDVFASQRCDCGNQLHDAMRMVAEAGKGVILYMRQEGRGIGLANKLHAYRLQDEEGMDTVEANNALGFPADLRHYGVGAQILYDLGIRKIRLLTNNPKKVVALKGYDLEIVERVQIEPPANDSNRRYLETKRDKMGHLLQNLPGESS